MDGMQSQQDVTIYLKNVDEFFSVEDINFVTEKGVGGGILDNYHPFLEIDD